MLLKDLNSVYMYNCHSHKLKKARRSNTSIYYFCKCHKRRRYRKSTFLIEWQRTNFWYNVLYVNSFLCIIHTPGVWHHYKRTVVVGGVTLCRTKEKIKTTQKRWNANVLNCKSPELKFQTTFHAVCFLREFYVKHLTYM